jgi:hypothetical protein
VSSNGHLTTAELSPAAGGIPGPDPGQGQLANDAAAAWNAMNAYSVAHHGVHLTCNGSDSMYRPYARQVYWRNYWCARGACQNAAVPGSSNHGLGKATDDPPYVQAICDSAECAQFGWNKSHSDAPWESWHRLYNGTYHGSDPGAPGHGADRYPTLKKGDHGDAVKRAQTHLHRWNVGLTRPKPDGDFGEGTKKAVVQFQKVHGLKPDGVVGHSTWMQLRQKDHFLDDEREHLNRFRLLRVGGVSKSERARVRAHKVFFAKRAASIKTIAQKYGWKDQHRAERYQTLKNAAGGKS